MKNKIYLIFSLLLLFGGCSGKSTFFSDDKIEQSVIINTKKGQLYSSLEIKATIVSTYLNSSVLEFKDNKNETFLVSIYVDDDSLQKDEQGIYHKDYLLTLNGKKAVTTKLLDYKDDLIKLTPIRSRWSHYYLVGFAKDSNEKLMMEFKNSAYGEVVLKYQKEL